jgi:hypothetical protein
MRHQAITELAESGASEQTIMSVSGHVSRKMLEHYSHIRLEAKREAVRVLSSLRRAEETGGHVTERVTTERKDEEILPQPLKNVVDVTGIEPVTPCLQGLAARRINKLRQLLQNKRELLQLATPSTLNGPRVRMSEF